MHVGDRGMQAASDIEIWDYALLSSATIVTKDEDFAQRKVLVAIATGRARPAVVWIRLPNLRRRDLLVRFESILPDVVAALARGETLIEVV